MRTRGNDRDVDGGERPGVTAHWRRTLLLDGVGEGGGGFRLHNTVDYYNCFRCLRAIRNKEII